MKLWQSLALNIAGGVSLWAANAPLSWWPLTFIALALFWVSLQGRKIGGGLLVGFIFGFTFFFLLLDWTTTSTGTILARFALAGLEASFLALLGGLWIGLRRIQRLPFGYVVLAAGALWVAIEQFRSVVPFGGMPWGSLGFGLVDSPLIHLAPVGSVHLVGFIAACAGVLLGCAMEKIAGGWEGAFNASVALGFAVLAILMPGLLPIGARPAETLQVAVVQGNVPEAPTQHRALKVTENHAVATKRILDEKPDVILWPESASDRDFREDAEAAGVIAEVSQQAKVPLLLGTQSYAETTRTNDYVVLTPDGITETYTKQHPVPFGEYMPFRESLRKVTSAVDQVDRDMIAGEKPAVLTVPLGEREVKVATPICFEIAYTELVAEAVNSGAQLIVAPTNNASFGLTAESAQQFAMARFRAVEHRKPVIQVATSGISGLVDTRGIIRYQTELFTQDARIIPVALSQAVSLATQTAAQRTILVYTFGIVAALFSLWGIATHKTDRQDRKRSSRKPRKKA